MFTTQFIGITSTYPLPVVRVLSFVQQLCKTTNITKSRPKKPKGKQGQPICLVLSPCPCQCRTTIDIKNRPSQNFVNVWDIQHTTFTSNPCFQKSTISCYNTDHHHVSTSLSRIHLQWPSHRLDCWRQCLFPRQTRRTETQSRRNEEVHDRSRFGFKAITLQEPILFGWLVHQYLSLGQFPFFTRGKRWRYKQSTLVQGFTTRPQAERGRSTRDLEEEHVSIFHGRSTTHLYSKKLLQ